MRKITMSAMCLLLLALSACMKRSNPEENGYACLGQARAALAAKDFDRARRAIDSMRTHFPMALNAREDGILLRDSVDLAQAHVQLEAVVEQMKNPVLDRISRDTLDFNRDELVQKVRFFERKIQHDKANKKQHEDRD